VISPTNTLDFHSDVTPPTNTLDFHSNVNPPRNTLDFHSDVTPPTNTLDFHSDVTPPTNTLDFEAIQSSNWNDMRLKPPPSLESDLGWLVEFRCMDSPLTEIEKSIMTFICTLFFRVICDSRLDIDFYLPMSKVDENFKRAFQRNATTAHKFFFRKHFCPLLKGFVQSDEVVEVTLFEFFNGSADFVGVKALFDLFVDLNASRFEPATQQSIAAQLDAVLSFISDKCSGKIDTTPNFFRNYVFAHPDYKHDSLLSDSICTDLIDLAIQVSKDNYHPLLFGKHRF
jgi:glutamate--cysteine ligase catalytic subunit